MRTLQLYGAGSSTANAVAQVTIPASSMLLAIGLHMRFDTVTDNGVAVIEFSKVSTSEIAVNGALDPFLTIGGSNNLVTSGMTLWAINETFPLRVPCRQGEIIYFHALVSNVSYTVNAILHLSA